MSCARMDQALKTGKGISSMFWKKNIQALGKHHAHHEAIIRKLKNVVVPESLDPYETADGGIGIVYQGIPLHAPSGAIAEAEKEVKHNCRPALDRVSLILGLGLGYLLEATYQKTPGPIVIYEPHLPLLKFILENSDLSTYFSKFRVRLVTSIPELLEVMGPLLINREPIDFLSSGGYTLLLKAEIPDLMHKMANLIDDRKRDYATSRYFHNMWMKQFFDNLPYVADCHDITVLKGKGKGKPAIIISRGPSLDAALPAIKQLENQAVLVAVGGALHHLYKAGITPDFATFLDARGMNEQLHGIPKSYLKNIVFLMSGFTQPDCFEEPAAAKIRFTLQSDRPYAQFLSKTEPQVHNYLLLDGCGTVSHIALQAGMIMDCNPVVIIGQDLAFPNNQVYAGGEALKSTTANGKEIMTLERREDLFTGASLMAEVEGQNGEMLKTLASFKGFIRYFEKTAEANERKTNRQKLYNASIGGAKIKGYEVRPMDSFVGEWTDFRTPDWLTSQLQLPDGFREKTLEKLQTKLRALKSELYELLALLDRLIVTEDTTPHNPELKTFIARHYLISHFLVLDMIDIRQQYNPSAETPEEKQKNDTLIKDAHKRYRTLVADSILPWLVSSETRIMQALNPMLIQTPSA